MMAEPGQETWNRFWGRDRDPDQIYPTSRSGLDTITSRLRVAGMSVLEVGAGTGRDSLELARRGAHVTVLDFAENGLKITETMKRRAGLANMHLVRADALRTPFPNGTFDLVFHQGLLEHFREPLPLLRENHRIVKPGGWCLCDVPQTFHPYTVVKHGLMAADRWFAGWETQYTARTLTDLMKRARFEVVYTYGDWMRPSFAYRLLREAAIKCGVRLPMYPLMGTRYEMLKDRLLDWLSTYPASRYCQASIGVLGHKP